MNKINLNTILKHLTGILCALFLVSFLFPFGSAEATASSGGTSVDGPEVSISGTSIVTSGGLWGILILASLLAIALSSYLPQLAGYKKMICLAGSGILILSLFMVTGTVASAVSTGGEAGAGITGSADIDVDVKINYLIGFWIMLVDSVLLLGLSIINFFDLKGNPVFDAVNTANESNESMGGGSASIDFSEQLGNIKEKVTSVAQNIGESVSNVAGNISSSATSATSSESNSVAVGAKSTQKPAVKKLDPDYIMENIKKLHEMKESGILTEEEFAQKKKEFLEKM
ncbi:MAG: SHOCT domain-containing protein [Acutalibacteraceae bacterium]